MPQAPIPLLDYSDAYQAERDAELLEAHGIPCLVKQEYETFNPAFTLKASLNSVHLLVDPDTHDEARRLLSREHDEADVPAPTVESLLATWDDEELMAVAARPDEWNAGTVAAAETLLQRRGVRFSEVVRFENERRRTEATRHPRSGDDGWIMIGFLLAVAGGLGGILMGLGYRLLEELDAHGEPFPVYDDRTRELGKWMIRIGWASAVLWFWFAIFM